MLITRDVEMALRICFSTSVLLYFWLLLLYLINCAQEEWDGNHGN